MIAFCKDCNVWQDADYSIYCEDCGGHLGEAEKTTQLEQKPRTYYGVLIHPMGRNSWGGRWEAHVNGTFKCADTLAGMKAVIRRELKVGEYA